MALLPAVVGTTTAPEYLPQSLPGRPEKQLTILQFLKPGKALTQLHPGEGTATFEGRVNELQQTETAQDTVKVDDSDLPGGVSDDSVQGVVHNNNIWTTTTTPSIPQFSNYVAEPSSAELRGCIEGLLYRLIHPQPMLMYEGVHESNEYGRACVIEEETEDNLMCVRDCVYLGEWCETHEVELISSRTKQRFRTKCRDSLYRMTYRFVKIWNCPAKSEKITKPLKPNSGEILSCPNLKKTFSNDVRVGKRDRGGKFLAGTLE